MARTMFVVAFCLCMAVAFAADLRRLSAEKPGGVVPATAAAAKVSADAKDGDQQTAAGSFYGYGFYGPGYGFGGPLYGGFGGGWGGYGGGPYGYGGYGWGYPGFGYGGFW